MKYKFLNLAHIGTSWVWVTLLAFSLVLQLLPCTPVSSSLLPFHPSPLSEPKDLEQVHHSTVQSPWTTSPLLLQLPLRKPGAIYRAHFHRSGSVIALLKTHSLPQRGILPKSTPRTLAKQSIFYSCIVCWVSGILRSVLPTLSLY